MFFLLGWLFERKKKKLFCTRDAFREQLYCFGTILWRNRIANELVLNLTLSCLIVMCVDHQLFTKVFDLMLSYINV